MMKEEFEALAIRGNKTISYLLYEKIERYYMSDNNYHAQYGGINESKQDFVKRVFGGKVNTPKTIAEKLAKESCKENRWRLNGNPSADEKRLAEMDSLIWNHVMWESKTETFKGELAYN